VNSRLSQLQSPHIALKNLKNQALHQKMVHKPSIDEILSDTIEPPTGPPCIVHTNAEMDTFMCAKGLRIAHRDACLVIRAHSIPDEVLPPGFVEAHGLEFSRRVVIEIAKMNHEEVSDFAKKFSLRYRHNVKALLHSLSRPPSDVFTSHEQARYGTTFLTLVLENCRQGMMCVEGLQHGIRSGAIPKDGESPQPTGESAKPAVGSTQTNSRKQSDVSRVTATDLSRASAVELSRSTLDSSRGTQTDITSGRFIHAAPSLTNANRYHLREPT
jgi:hypothetical protein